MAAAVAAVASHAAALSGGYLWLDHAHLEQGLALKAPRNWPELFTEGYAGTGFYRPLMALSLSLDATVSKSAFFFHLVTLGWHAAASVMTGVAARALGGSRRVALVAGVLFAVHPLTTLVASAIAFRSEAMMAVFLLGLVAAHLAQRPVLAASTLFAGALTKETAWVLGPFFIAALEVLGRGERSSARRPADPEAKGRRRLLAAEGVAIVAATALRWSYAPAFRAEHAELPLDEGIGSRLAAFGKSALTLLVPLDGTICDAFPITQTASVAALLGAAALAGVFGLVLRRGGAAYLFGLSLLPSLQLVPIMRWWSPHYLYLPLAFGVILLAQGVDGWVRKHWAIASALGLLLAALSLKESFRYASDQSLWAPEVAREPACREGQFFLGETAQSAGEWELAAMHYQRAAEPVPGYLSYADELAALQNLGAVRLAQEHWAEARSAWMSALERSSAALDKRQITHNLGTLALKRGDPEEAARLLESETSRVDALPESLWVRAKALHALGREQEALRLIARLEQAARQRPRGERARVP